MRFLTEKCRNIFNISMFFMFQYNLDRHSKKFKTTKTAHATNPTVLAGTCKLKTRCLPCPLIIILTQLKPTLTTVKTFKFTLAQRKTRQVRTGLPSRSAVVTWRPASAAKAPLMKRKMYSVQFSNNAPAKQNRKRMLMFSATAKVGNESNRIGSGG